MIIRAIYVVALLSVSAPGAAQVPLQSNEQAKQVRRALAFGAECLVRRQSGAVRSFLAKFPGSKDGIRNARYLTAGDCVDGSSGAQQLSFSPDVIRGALFKTLYNGRYGAAAPSLASGDPDFAAEAVGSPAVLADPYVAARRFGVCVVRRDAIASRTLVLADVETEAEYRAFAALNEPIADCTKSTANLPPVSRTMVVGAIAEVVYRLSVPAAGTRD